MKMGISDGTENKRVGLHVYILLNVDNLNKYIYWATGTLFTAENQSYSNTVD